MNVSRSFAAIFASFLVAAAPCFAAKSGTQLSRDFSTVLVQKDVGAERWAISLALDGLAVTGNVFFTDARPPAFLSCVLTSLGQNLDTFQMSLSFNCFGSDPAQGAFRPADYTLIAENVELSAEFFFPDPGTCDLTAATNGPTELVATSRWQCTGAGQPFTVGLSLDGNGSISKTGQFTYPVETGGCGYRPLTAAADTRLLYSPTRDVLNVIEQPEDTISFVVSTCERVGIP